MQKKLIILSYENKILSMLYEGNRMSSVHVYDENTTSLVGNIYVGRVSKIMKNLQAAFVDIKSGFPCFLPLNDLKDAILLNREYDGVLKQGDEILVQVEKDAIKTKQPVLTTHLRIAGTYVVCSLEKDLAQNGTLIPNTVLISEGNKCIKVGISSKLKKELKTSILKNLEENGCLDAKSAYPISMIVRTNAGNLSEITPLIKEWNTLKSTLENILDTAAYRNCYSCLYKQNNLIAEELKNYYQQDYDEIVTDCKDIYEVLAGLDLEKPVRFYEDSYSLSKLYSVDTQLKDALRARVWLESGAYLIIEHTEALTVIDVNSGKKTTWTSREDNFAEINYEAAKEIAFQIKLRNISGIILIDFINMETEEDKKHLLAYLRDCVKSDSVKVNVIDMTALGLVEVTRKRISRPLRELFPNYL